jgi:cysteine desulfurase
MEAPSTYQPDRPIYLDYCATTPVDERVFARMAPFFTEQFGNATSRHHAFGWDAREAVEAARLQVAALINARPGEMVFTSGATESINLAIKGVMQPHRGGSPHLITTAVEHSAVLNTCRFLEAQGVAVTYLPVDHAGRIGLDQLEASITAQTRLISVMAANNEIGTLYPLAEIGKIARRHGVLFFTDATQAAGKIPLDVVQQHIDLLAFSAHKIYGPKGIGALFVRGGDPVINLLPQTHGGGQEQGLRSGTPNVPGIVGFGEACRLALVVLPEESQRVLLLRNRLERALLACLPDIHVNGAHANRLPNLTHLAFDAVEGKDLVGAIHPVAASIGAACTRTAGPSPVLKAIGLTNDQAYASVRFSVGRFTTEAEIDYTVAVVAQAVHRLRQPFLAQHATRYPAEG